jgi:hypothetical protein
MSLMRHGFASANSRLSERLRCGLRAERMDIQSFLPLGGTKRTDSAYVSTTEFCLRSARHMWRWAQARSNRSGGEK